MGEGVEWLNGGVVGWSFIVRMMYSWVRVVDVRVREVGLALPSFCNSDF